MLRKIVYPSFVVLLPFLMYVQIWHGADPERTYFTGDAGDSYYPDLRAIENALFDGQFPLWNPYDRAGFPFAADPQTGVLYPLNWLLALIGHLQGGVSFGLTQFKMLLHISIAGLSMYLFMRDREQPEPSAAVAAVSYQFGAYFAPQALFSLIWPLAWTPLLLRSFDRLFARPTLLSALAVAGFMGLITNAGSPPGAFYGALIALPYFGLRLAESLEGVRLKQWAASTGVHVLLAGGVGIMLSLPQLLATMVLTKHSVLAKPSFAHASSGSVLPEELLGLAVRSLSGHHYEGICALFLACLGLLYYRARRDVAVFLALIVVGLIMMLGVHTQLFRVAFHFIPGVDRFRLCYRYVALVSFAVSVLASFGLTALIERTISDRALRYFGACALLLAVIALYLDSVRADAVRDPMIVRDLTVLAVLLGAAVALAHGTYRHVRSRAGLCACMVGLMSLDYASFIQRVGTQGPGPRARPENFTQEELQQLRGDLSGYRVFNEFALGFRAGSLERYRDFRGYFDPLLLGRYSAIMFEQLKYHPAKIMGLFNVKYYAFSPHPEIAFGHHFVPQPDQTAGFKRLKPTLYEIADPSPNAYWVGQIDLQPDDPEVRAQLPTLDPRRTALMAKKDLSPAERKWARSKKISAHDAVAARVLGRGFNYVTFAVTAPAEGLLVVNEAWFPGWTAEVDGKSAGLMRVNSLVQGVRLGPGSHRVELRFRPYYFLVPLWLALLALAGLALAFTLRARARRRSSLTPT